MATLHRAAGGKEILLVKDAPEVILEHCDRQQSSGGVPASLGREHFMEASDKLAAQGERVLALAWLENPGVRAGSLSPADLPKTLVLLGLIGLLDPPRKEAIEAVEECRSGGIRVTMITGDHRRRNRTDERHHVAGEGARRRRIRAREPGAQAPAGEGDSGE
jgi:magnesium-transporting ATPase (P-type)